MSSFAYVGISHRHFLHHTQAHCRHAVRSKHVCLKKHKPQHCTTWTAEHLALAGVKHCVIVFSTQRQSLKAALLNTVVLMSSLEMLHEVNCSPLPKDIHKVVSDTLVIWPLSVIILLLVHLNCGLVACNHPSMHYQEPRQAETESCIYNKCQKHQRRPAKHRQVVDVLKTWTTVKEQVLALYLETLLPLWLECSFSMQFSAQYQCKDQNKLGNCLLPSVMKAGMHELHAAIQAASEWTVTTVLTHGVWRPPGRHIEVCPVAEAFEVADKATDQQSHSQRGC